MAAQVSLTVLALAALALGPLGCAHAFANAPAGACTRVPLAPPGVFVEDDVANGYAAYADVLAPWGQWESDSSYGVHWCPARVAGTSAFHPYRSSGHWSTSDRTAYGSPPGTVYWEDDDSGAWSDTTTHHGWWVERGMDDWCWVPGARETPARVVWRSNDDFVGWAPEPPSWVDDGDEDASAGFEWMFELLGTLLEDAIDGYVLKGEPAQQAARATAPDHAGSSSSGFSRRPPPRIAVGSAREKLVAYAGAHPGELASVTPTASVHPTSRSSVPSTSSPSSGTSSSASDAKADTTADRLPPGPLLVGVMMSDPAWIASSESRIAMTSGDPEGGRYADGAAMGGAVTATQPNRSTKTRAVDTPSHTARSNSYHFSSHGSSGGSSHTVRASSSSSHRR